MPWTQFFTQRIPHIYFAYGLAFFILGMAVALEAGRAEPSRFKRAMWSLAGFGILHGLHEWVEMFVLVGQVAYGFQSSTAFEFFRLTLLTASFAALIVFGVQMLHPVEKLPLAELWLGVGILLFFGAEIFFLSQTWPWPFATRLVAVDALARYTLAVPGSILTTIALLSQRKSFVVAGRQVFANDLLLAALAFLLYGLVGQVFVGRSPLFPSNILNAEFFLSLTGIPIQLFRAATAVLVAFFTIRALRAFEYSRRQELEAARQRVVEEIARRDLLRQEFVRRIVEMQEEERARIARELHDEFGQALTGLAIGLRGAQESVQQPQRLQRQLAQLEEMAVQALGNMRHIVNELRPALLDDMGLPAALRHYRDTFQDLTGIQVHLALGPSPERLPATVETILFRITQEALTNIARHAHARQAWIDLHCRDNQAILTIRDDGQGFDVQSVMDSRQQMGMGLLGIQERVNLTGGMFAIRSEPGQGTTISISIPLSAGEEVVEQ